MKKLFAFRSRTVVVLLFHLHSLWTELLRLFVFQDMDSVRPNVFSWISRMVDVRNNLRMSKLEFPRMRFRHIVTEWIVWPEITFEKDSQMR